MTSGFSSAFTTLVRNNYVTSATVIQSDTLANADNPCNEYLQVGGWSAKFSGGQILGYLTFDVGALPPANQMYSIESAKVTGSQATATGTFYSISSVQVTKIQYYDDFYMVIQNYQELANVGILSTSDTPATVSLDSTESFKNDFVTNGLTMHMYKLGPSAFTGSPSESGTHANFACDGFRLDVTYLIP
jgi:hypothetical protein